MGEVATERHGAEAEGPPDAETLEPAEAEPTPAPADDDGDETPPDDDDGDETPPDDDDGDETPPAGAAGAVSEKDLERATEKLVREATRHANRVSEIMGADAQVLATCELCEPAIPGFRWPQVPDYDTVQAVLAAVGLGDAAELADDPDAEMCDLCEGHGELVTGSKVLNQRTRPCGKCGANGWTTPEQRATWEGTARARNAAATLPALHEAPPPETTPLPSSDAWGRPAGHEFYGRHPTYMTDAERARDLPGAV